jgi:uncharacterized SAM-binding protein YcdF (DUF218 family)
MFRRRLTIVISLVFLGLWGTSGLAVHHAGSIDEAGPADAIVVLGARVNPGGVASTTLHHRAMHGLQLWQRKLAPFIVSTGGVGVYGPSEAQVACSLTIDAGLPPAACVLEANSHTTYENAHFAAPLLRERGVRTVLLVSDDYHLPRARRFFAAEGFEVRTSPCPPAEVHPLLRLGWTLREVPALLKQRFFGR